MMNPMCSSVILLFCVTFIMLGHCSVQAMQSGRNINAEPFIPQQQQQQQQEQQQRQWQQDQECANLYGIPSHHRQRMAQYLSQQIPPQYLDESNFYGIPSPQQYHQHHQQFPEHLDHQFPSQRLGGHQQMLPHSPSQAHSLMAGFSSSPQMMSPMNPFNTAFSSNDPLRHLTSLLQRIPQGTTSLFFEDPTSIVGTSNKQLKEPLNPERVISSSSTESPRITEPSVVKEDGKNKFTFGTIEDNVLPSMNEKELEKPKSRGIPPGFPAKNSSGRGDASHKEITKYSEAVKKPSASPTSKSSLNPKSPNTIESSKSAIPEENVVEKEEGKEKSKTNVSDDKMSWRKHESSSTSGTKSTKPDGASLKSKDPGLKSKEQKRNGGKQEGKVRTNVTPKEMLTEIRAEFLPTNKETQRKTQVCAKSEAKKADDDEDLDLDASLLNQNKLDSKLVKEISGSSSDFRDALDIGLNEETFADALPFFETKVKKKKNAKQIKREKELADAEAIKDFAKKWEKELADAKGKAKTEEITEEIDEKSAKNKEKLKAAKDHLELDKNTTDQVQSAVINDIFRQWNHGVKDEASETTYSLTRFFIPPKNPVDHHNEIKLLINILNYERIKGISIENAGKEEQAKKDIHYLLYTVQVFYETLDKYWSRNYYFYQLSLYSYIGDVLTKIGLFYTDKGANEENVKQFERVDESLRKSFQILISFWMIPEYREFMESQELNMEEGKYKFVKWMEAFEQLLDALKLFYVKIKRFNKFFAKKNYSLERLKVQYEKSAIQMYFKTNLYVKFKIIFGIIYIGMDKQIYGVILRKNRTLIGLNYLKYLMPDRWVELAHIRKVMWNYFEILDYIKINEIQTDFKTHFQSIMEYPMPKGNYIEIKERNYANFAVKSAESMLKRKGNRDKISPEVKNALNAVKEHLLCANFLIIMYEKIYHEFDDKTNKHNVHMETHERNFWHVVDKYKCIPAEENYKKIEISPEYQKFLQDHPMFKNKMEDAIKCLDDLYIEYNIEERRREAAGQCECCKPEEGYDKDSEEKKEGLEKTNELENADKNKEEEAEEKQ